MMNFASRGGWADQKLSSVFSPHHKRCERFFPLCLRQMWVDQNFPAGEMRKLHIHGNKTQVEAAMREVEELIRTAPVNAMRPGKMSPEVGRDGCEGTRRSAPSPFVAGTASFLASRSRRSPIAHFS